MDTAPSFAQPLPQQPAAAEAVAPPPPPPDSNSADTPPPSNRFSPAKLLVVGAIAALVILLVAAGGYFVFRNMVTQQQANAPIALTYWGLWEPGTVLEGVIERYQTLHPNVTINYEMRPDDNHYETVRSRISTNSGGEVPDIVRVHASWVPVLRNYLSPIPSSVMTVNDYEQAFYPVTRDQLFADGAYYGMPLMIDGLSLVYNQELFDAAGVTQVPTTWDEVRQASAKLTQRDEDNNILVAGMAMGSARNVDHYADIIGLLMAQNGVVFTDDKGNFTFHQSISGDGRNLGAETLSFFTLFTAENYWSDAMEPSTVSFSKGKVAMILVPSWRVLSLIEDNPQLQVRVAPVPHLTTDQRIGYATYWTEVVPKSSPHQQAAWDFVKFLADQEQQVNLFSVEQQLRTFGEPFSRQGLAGNLESDPFVGPYIQQAPDFRASIFANDTHATPLNDAINAALAEAITQVQQAGNSRDSAAASAIVSLAEKTNSIVSSQR